MSFSKKLTIKILQKIITIIVALFVIYIAGLATGSGINILNIDTSSLDFERILFIPGVSTSASELNRWKRDLAFNFPEEEIIFLDEIFYFHWQDEKTEKMVEKGIKGLDDGKSTLIIAHSYGGILAKTIINKSENENVVKLITMASPHTMESFGIDDSKEFLNTPDEVTVPTYSFGGYIDPIVFFTKSDVEDSEHLDLWSNHNGFLSNKDIRRKVLFFALGLNYTE